MGGLAPVIFFFSLVETSSFSGGFMKENFIGSPAFGAYFLWRAIKSTYVLGGTKF